MPNEKSKAEQIVTALDNYVNELIQNAMRDPGESSCGGTYNYVGYRAELVASLDAALPEGLQSLLGEVLSSTQDGPMPPELRKRVEDVLS